MRGRGRECSRRGPTLKVPTMKYEVALGAQLAYFMLRASSWLFLFVLLCRFGDDAHLERHGDVAVELDRDLIFADALDRIGQLQLAPIEVEAFCLQRLGDVRARHRAV